VSVLVAILVVALIGAVAFVVSAPLRSSRRHGGHAPAQSAAQIAGEQARTLRRDELGVARTAKYQEIRDTELDYRTGKLSREDFETIDRELRAEALEILNRLQQLEQSPPPGGSFAAEEENPKAEVDPKSSAG
jgi:hypothetical protein